MTEGNMVDPKYRHGAMKVGDRTVRTRTDAVGLALATVAPEKLDSVVKKNKLAGKVVDNPENYNPGQYRMAIGNSLRAKVRKGETVTVGKHEITDLDQKIEVPAPAEPKTPAAKKAA